VLLSSHSATSSSEVCRTGFLLLLLMTHKSEKTAPYLSQY
jgi:hypothetical protein